MDGTVPSIMALTPPANPIIVGRLRPALTRLMARNSRQPPIMDIAELKNRVHGGRVSYTSNADQCRACGLCVKACPEHAIKLVKANS
jgi:NAD-dependent dihydropyrimidine dehydrogenase PreA subunit